MDTTTVTRLNPSTWNSGFRYDQGQLRPAPGQVLHLAGQGALDAEGTLQHPGETGPQLRVAMQNVEDLLTAGGMTLADVLTVTLFVTDMDAALAAYGEVTDRLDHAGATPPATLVEVSRLAVPGMTVEITASAGR